MTWLAYIVFTAVLAGVLGLFIAFGMLSLARWCNRLPSGRAQIAYAGSSFIVMIIGFAALGLSVATAAGPVEYGPGYGTGDVLAIGISILSGVTIGFLLLVGRLSERAMVILISSSLSLGWWLAEDAPFFFCDRVLGAPFFDANSYSPFLHKVSITLTMFCKKNSVGLPIANLRPSLRPYNAIKMRSSTW